MMRACLCEGNATGLSIRAALEHLHRQARVVVCFGIQAIKATHDYLRFDSVHAAERGLCEGLAELQSEGKNKQVTKNSLVRI